MCFTRAALAIDNAGKSEKFSRRWRQELKLQRNSPDVVPKASKVYGRHLKPSQVHLYYRTMVIPCVHDTQPALD